jgi:glyoxylase-like metal-dependent hydrolase (beta-lactamase superfamily II)
MREAQQISRRTWLTRVALGSFAVWSELTFGFGRRGWGVAIGGSDLGVGIAHAQNLESAKTLQINLGIVNAYVLIRGKEAAVVDTGTPNNGSKIAEVVRTASLDWSAVHHVILTHYHPDHIGDEVFGLRVIATPGHTPGHVCVFDPAGSLLILGDAMTNIGNKLGGPSPQYTADMAQAHQSVNKLSKLKFQRAVFGHGEPIDNGASQAIAKLAGTL